MKDFVYEKLLDEFKGVGNIYLFGKDKHLRYTFCNDALCHAQGLDSPRDIIGKTDAELPSKQHINCYQDGDIRVLNGKTYINEPEKQLVNNKDIDILTTKSILVNKQNKAFGLVGVCISMNNQHIISAINSALSPTSLDQLTTRELQIVRLLSQGHSAKQISDRLGISRRTVEIHLANAREKYNCGKSTELIRLFLEKTSTEPV